jgi:hypothetical protein
MGADGLSSLGWDERAARAVAEGMAPGCAAGRVIPVDLDSVVAATEAGDFRARARELPAVGDWVVAHVEEDDAVVVGVAPRWSELARRDPAGRTQVLAANVDLVLVTAPADRLSVARVEREVALGWDSGARPDGRKHSAVRAGPLGDVRLVADRAEVRRPGHADLISSASWTRLPASRQPSPLAA